AESPMKTLGRADPSGGAGTDRALLGRLRCGDRDAAAALYRRYAPRLRGLTRLYRSSSAPSRFDADDVVQSTFASFFRRASAYDPSSDGDVWRLLVKIAHNRIRALRNYHRAARRDVRQTRPAADLDTLPADDFAFDQTAVRDVLERLPPEYRKVV